MTTRGRIQRTLEAVLGVPVTTGNSIEILRNGDEIFPAMLHAIAEAERSIDLLTFIYWNGDIARVFANQLSARAQAGVRVRVLLDAAGAWDLDESLVQRMCDAGCDVRIFRPITARPRRCHANNRTHRKVLICDEAVSFTGGVGIADEWRGDAHAADEWRDTHFRVVGPATDGLRAAFLDNWAETGPDLVDPTHRPLPRTTAAGRHRHPGRQGDGRGRQQRRLEPLPRPGRDGRDPAADQHGVLHARRRDPAAALRGIQRGVEVEVMVPGPHADKRVVQIATEADYAPLLEAGVEPCTASRPAMLHAKVLTIDGVAVGGRVGELQPALDRVRRRGRHGRLRRSASPPHSTSSTTPTSPTANRSTSNAGRNASLLQRVQERAVSAVDELL